MDEYFKKAHGQYYMAVKMLKSVIFHQEEYIVPLLDHSISQQLSYIRLYESSDAENIDDMLQSILDDKNRLTVEIEALNQQKNNLEQIKSFIQNQFSTL